MHQHTTPELRDITGRYRLVASDDRPTAAQPFAAAPAAPRRATRMGMPAFPARLAGAAPVASTVHVAGAK